MLSRPDAILACKEAHPQGHLAIIPDKTTNDFILSMVNIRSLIGLSRISDEWVWEDGTKASYTNWMLEEPSGDGSAVELIQQIWEGDFVPGQWNDFPVGSTLDIKGYVCQYNPNKPFLAATKQL